MNVLFRFGIIKILRNFRNNFRGNKMEDKKYQKRQDLYIDVDGVLVSLAKDGLQHIQD